MPEALAGKWAGESHAKISRLAQYGRRVKHADLERPTHYSKAGSVSAWRRRRGVFRTTKPKQRQDPTNDEIGLKPTHVATMKGKTVATAASAKEEPFVTADTRPDRLTGAEFVQPGRLKLTFADGLSVRLAVRKLGMPVDRICWATAAASSGGESMTVRGVRGDAIPIDSATLRYLVDKEYAAGVDATLKTLQFSREELQELASESSPPPGWFVQSEKDLTRESR